LAACPGGVVLPFGERVVLDTTTPFNDSGFMRFAEQRGLVRGGYLLTARIDDDDAWNPETVGIIRETAARWLGRPDHADAVVMTFELGYEWVS
jgi:hypothetical protein